MRSRRISPVAFLAALALATGCGKDDPASPGDTTSPSAVADLHLQTVSDSSLVVAWTAPGDDGMQGTASRYDIRHSPAMITSDTWESCTQVQGAPAPATAGTEQSVRIDSPFRSDVFVALKSADEVPNWSTLSNVASASAPPDTTPPAVVADLTVSGTTESTASLTWTSPGDDGTVGTASGYDIRYSTSRSTAEEFVDATQSVGEPAPRETGGTETFLVTGLQPGTTYWFVLRTSDEAQNWSSISNLDSARTEVPVPAMAYVPEGTFTMGDGEAYCGIDERSVTLTHAFLLGSTEVTNDEYLGALQWAYDHGYVDVTASTVIDNIDGSSVELLPLDDIGSEIAFSGGVFALADVGHGATNRNHPVKEVSWYGAVAYCDWLSMIAGVPRAYDHATWECNGGDPYGAIGYRLPTDAEWEYAAQYDDERVYPWGDEPPDCSLANGSLAGPCVGWTSAVGSYPGCPDIEGALLYDMAGNITEWCNDRFTCSLGTAPETDPVGSSTNSDRVVRGGAWTNLGDRMPCAARRGEAPYAFSWYGFRCARSQ